MALVSLHLTVYRVRHIVITDCESYRGHRVHSKVREDRASTCRVEMTKYAHTHTHVLTQMALHFILFTPCIFLHSV